MQRLPLTLRFVWLFSVVVIGPLSAQVPVRPPDGGGVLEPQSGPCLSPDDYVYIQREVRKNESELREHGIIPSAQLRNGITPIGWPLRNVDVNYNRYWSLVNYVDQDTTSGILDYRCGDNTYDGHKGIDISSYPFWWYIMDNNTIEVIAAAEGTIIYKIDGNDDRSCEAPFNNWNCVIVLHDDGTRALYGHLKKNSLTSKEVGMRVDSAEYLGEMGSSGFSSNPHIHFELQESDFTPIEPFFSDDPQNDCNVMNDRGESWWSDQKDYWEPRVNAMFTHSDVPNIAFCPEDERTNFENWFTHGSEVYLGIYQSDRIPGEQAYIQIIKPDGEVLYAWFIGSQYELQWSWNYWMIVIPDGAPQGTWTYRVTYNGDVVDHHFYVDCESDLTVQDQTVSNAGLFQAANQVETSGVVTIASVTETVFRGGSIHLNPGFSVSAGASFRAYTDGCATLPARTNKQRLVAGRTHGESSPVTNEPVKLEKEHKRPTLTVVQPVQNDELTLFLDLNESEEVTLEMVDMYGRPVPGTVLEKTLPRGYSPVSLRLPLLAPGTYILLAHGSETNIRKTIVIQ